MNIGDRPIYTKGQATDKNPKRMRQVSAKRAKQHASPEGKADLAYMGMVRQLPCCICGTRQNVIVHHCKDIPPYYEQSVYSQLPCAGRKSGAPDTIPLCQPGCHQFSGQGYHDSPAEWRERNGPDYYYIPATRLAVAAMQREIG